MRLGFQVSLKLNQKYFTVRIVQSLNNSNVPGFICEGQEVNSKILSSLSNAINNAYKQVFGKCKTKYSGATMLGFHNSYIIQQMLEDVGFHPFIVYLHNIKIFIASISNNCKEFASCFTYKYNKSKA